MTSKREQVLVALASLVAAALPLAEVKRNQEKPDRVPPAGMVILFDGDPGEPTTFLSPASYLYEHRIPVDVAAAPGQPLDDILSAIGAAIAADRTLGGLCDFVIAEAPGTGQADADGTALLPASSFAIVATYETSDPLG